MSEYKPKILSGFEARRRFWAGTLDPRDSGGCWTNFDPSDDICTQVCPWNDLCQQDQRIVAAKNAEGMKKATPIWTADPPPSLAEIDRKKKYPVIPPNFFTLQSKILELDGVMIRYYKTGVKFGYRGKKMAKVLAPIDPDCLSIVFYGVDIREIHLEEADRYLLICPTRHATYRGKPMLIVTNENQSIALKVIRKARDVIAHKLKMYPKEDG